MQKCIVKIIILLFTIIWNIFNIITAILSVRLCLCAWRQKKVRACGSSSHHCCDFFASSNDIRIGSYKRYIGDWNVFPQNIKNTFSLWWDRA